MAETRNRGFASMDEAKQRAIASKGGKAAHRQGTAHEFTPEEARLAGRKGGERVSRNRDHMAHIGRLGGEASRRSRQSGNQGETPEQGMEMLQQENVGEYGRIGDGIGAQMSALPAERMIP